MSRPGSHPTLTAIGLLAFIFVALHDTARAIEPADVAETQPNSRTADRATLSFAGSVTVAPIHERLASQLASRFATLRIVLSPSSTADGFLRLADGSADVIGASRPIHSPEIERLGTEAFVEVPIALDGVTLVVPASNQWLDYLTLEELKDLWSGTARTWADVRLGWPDQPVSRHAYGDGSGTVDSLLQVLGLARIAADTTLHPDREGQLTAVATEAYAIGQVGLAAATSNEFQIRTVPVDGGDGPVAPTPTSIGNAEYPLARQLWLYINRAVLLERPDVARFLAAYLVAAPSVVEELGFARLPPGIYRQALNRFEKRVTGSVFEGGMSNAGQIYGEQAVEE